MFCVLRLFTDLNVTGDKYALHRRWTSRSSFTLMPIAGLGKGGGLLEKPVIEKTAPGRESEFDLRYAGSTSRLFLRCSWFYVVR